MDTYCSSPQATGITQQRLPVSGGAFLGVPDTFTNIFKYPFPWASQISTISPLSLNYSTKGINIDILYTHLHGIKEKLHLMK
jgi:hypothetical protein